MYVHRQEHSFHHTGYKNYRLSQIQYKHHRTISLNIRTAKSANPNRDTTSITRQILYQIHQSRYRHHSTYRTRYRIQTRATPTDTIRARSNSSNLFYVHFVYGCILQQSHIPIAFCGSGLFDAANAVFSCSRRLTGRFKIAAVNTKYRLPFLKYISYINNLGSRMLTDQEYHRAQRQ